MVNHVQILSLVVLFVLFLGVPTISKMLGSTLDSLPIRFLAVILILASVRYDGLISLGVFLVVAALYIHHHNNDLSSIRLSSSSSSNTTGQQTNSGVRFEVPAAMAGLEDGGQADVTDDMMDFMPKRDIQDNEVHQTSAQNSINEKHVLGSEPLGASRAQNLFGEDARNARNLEQWSKDGSI